MEKCIFEPCEGSTSGKPLSKAGPQRIRSIINASKIYQDNRHDDLEKLLAADENATVLCHKDCVSTYTSKSHLQRHLKHHPDDAEKVDVPTEKKSRRSETASVFAFREDCLFCGMECVMDVDPKNPSRWRKVVLCRTANRGPHQKSFKDTILEVCEQRKDEQSQQVKLRVIGALSDLHAADARYHKDCRDSFMVPRSIQTAATNPISTESDTAFLSTTSELEADKSKMWNSVDVHKVYISHGGEKLSRRALITKLSHFFHPDLIVLTGTGVANILVFQSRASGLLRLVPNEDGDDLDLALETVSRHILRESKELVTDKAHYRAGIDIDIALECVSPTLLSLLDKLSDKFHYDTAAALIGNIISSVLTNRPTALQIALGIVLNTRSLIEQFYNFHVTCSYDEVLRFKASAAAVACQDIELLGLSANKNGLIQVLSDNFDANISSQNGLISTHVLAILVTAADKYRRERVKPEFFPRLAAEEMKTQLPEDVPVQRYRGPRQPTMPESEAKRTVLPLHVLAKQAVALNRAKCLDFNFLKLVATKKDMVEYNGFNTQLSREQGHGLQPATKTIYRPLLDMNPADPDTILTAMVEAQRLTNMSGQHVTIFTNDQQLYKIAVGVKWVYHDRFLNFIPRLGGMHMLMSFVGCVGVLMSNTGLEDVMKSSFGSVQTMLSGKKFPQNVRALRIVTEELLLKISEKLDGYSDLENSLAALSKRSKTAKLWIECLITPVLIMMVFVRAEREGDWPLHLWAVREMMPYFFAAGHHNYARYGLYYLRSMERLPKDILQHFLKGDHVMRHKPGVWNGIWSDMFIETTFMRYGHGPNGIIGITLKPSALKK